MSTADHILAIDAGTGSGRCIVFDRRGRPVAAAQEPFTYRTFSDPDIPFVQGVDVPWPVRRSSITSPWYTSPLASLTRSASAPAGKPIISRNAVSKGSW